MTLKTGVMMLTHLYTLGPRRAREGGVSASLYACHPVEHQQSLAGASEQREIENEYISTQTTR